MNDLLIIGNGFDLDLGLQTSYSNFMNSIFFKESIKAGNQLSHYLNSVRNAKKWIDIENEIKQFALDDKGAGYSEKIKKDFQLLSDALCNYLSSIKDEVNNNSAACTVLSAVINGYTFKKIYSYNYTDLNKIIEKLGVKKQCLSYPTIEYVHGCLNDRSIILGFEDLADVNKKYLFMNKSFSRHFQSHSIQHDLIDADEIIFFGHSLGSTDYLYFEYFFELQSNKQLSRKESKKITIITRNHESRVEILTQLREMNKHRTDLLFGLNELNIFCTEEKGDIDKINEYCKRIKERGKDAVRKKVEQDAEKFRDK